MTNITHSHVVSKMFFKSGKFNFFQIANALKFGFIQKEKIEKRKQFQNLEARWRIRKRIVKNVVVLKFVPFFHTENRNFSNRFFADLYLISFIQKN